MPDSLDNAQIQSSVYIKQIRLLYQNQAVAILATGLLAFGVLQFVSASSDLEMLQPWGVLFAIVLMFRAVLTMVCLGRMASGAIDYRLAEHGYNLGVVVTASVWAGMIIWSFPQISAVERHIIIVSIVAMVSAGHITMGYRKTIYHAFVLITMGALIYSIYVSDLPGREAFYLSMILFTVYMIVASISSFKNISTLIEAEEDSISEQHKLLLQREQANLENRSKTEFLSRMSHELRTPLNAVIGLNELQMRDKDHPLDEVQMERANKVQDAGTHLLALVNDVLDLSMIESDSVRLEMEPVDCVQLTVETIRLLELKAKSNQVELGRVSRREPVWVMADKRRLRQVLLNLIDNAIKYNHTGGRVDVRLDASDDNRWRISVADTGPGIATEDQQALFKPFSRLAATQDKIEGTGVGLSLSKRLIEQMEGRIGLTSLPGQGSCFWIEMPSTDASAVEAVTEATAEHEEAQAAPMAELREGKLLLVEDNEVNQLVASDMLQGMGFELDVAGDGEQALQMIENNDYAAVLMDCQMPVMDGLTATREIRSMESLHGLGYTPVIALTAHAQKGARERCLDSGMDDFLSKPFAYDELLKVLGRWVSLPHHASIASSADEVSSDAEAETTSVIDTVALSRLRTRKSNLVGKVVKRYLEESPGILETMEQSANSGELEELSFQAHSFKSTSLTVGAVVVADFCRRIESECRSGEIDPATVPKLRSSLEMAERELLSILDDGAVSESVQN